MDSIYYSEDYPICQGFNAWWEKQEMERRAGTENNSRNSWIPKRLRMGIAQVKKKTHVKTISKNF